MKSVCYVAVWLTTASALLAQPNDTVTTSATSAPPLTLSGYVEAYYVYDVTAPKTAQERPGFLYNHKRNREVNVNLALLKAAYSASRVRATLALQVGTYAQYNYAAEQELVKNIYEAFAGVKLSRTQDLWLDAGIFGSHIGFESAVSKDCWTLTRSLMAENSPYYLSGAKLTYTSPNTQWTLLGSLVNGWQRIRKLPGYGGMAGSTQVQFRPSDKLTLNWSTFVGSDRPDSLKQLRFFNNFYAIINPQGRFGAILSYDVGTEQKPFVRLAGERLASYNSWSSAVVIARYKPTDQSTVNGRIEYYVDRRAVIIGVPDFRVWGYSLGYDYALVANALFRVEGKIFNSQQPVFETANQPSRTNVSLTTSLAVSF